MIFQNSKTVTKVDTPVEVDSNLCYNCAVKVVYTLETDEELFGYCQHSVSSMKRRLLRWKKHLVESALDDLFYHF